MGVKILSLFDGMACGMLAMRKAGVEVDEYTAYEIDKYAVQTATHNFPMIKECGDVFKADFTQYEGVDYVLAGFPCTRFSIAQKNNRETKPYCGEGWDLFEQAWRAVQEARPTYFLFENNKSMAQDIQNEINKIVGFEPICINSALVSAQNRQRLYWVGKRNADGTYSKVNVEQPQDRGILLKDILDIPIRFSRKKGVTECKDKSLAICSSDWRGINRNQIQNAVMEPVIFNTPHGYNKGGIVYDKFPTLTVNGSWQSNNFISEPVAVNLQVVGRKKNDNGEYECSWEARTDGKASTITSVDSRRMVAESVCMRYERSEEAKKVRKKYENGEIHHGFHELSELHPRTDGKTNTLSTVLKDNPICEPVRVGALPRPNGKLSNSQAMRVYDINGKSVNLCSGSGGMGAKTGLYAIPIEFENEKPTKAISYADGKTYSVYEVKEGQITIKEKQYPIKLADGYYIIRKLTVSECKRLQTVPEWYEFPVSDSQAYKMLGNGWTVDVIAHLIKATLAENI